MTLTLKDGLIFQRAVSREWTKFSPSWWWRGQWGLDQILPKSVVTWIVGSGSNSPGWDRLWQDADRWKEAAGDSGSPRDFLKICSEGKDSSCSLSFVSWTWNLIALFVLCGIYNRIFILSSSEEFIDVNRYLRKVEKVAEILKNLYNFGRLIGVSFFSLQMKICAKLICESCNLSWSSTVIDLYFFLNYIIFLVSIKIIGKAISYSIQL